jgi:hypothetical protein
MVAQMLVKFKMAANNRFFCKKVAIADLHTQKSVSASRVNSKIHPVLCITLGSSVKQ